MEEENELTSVSSIGGKPIKKVIEADYIQIDGTPTYVLSQTSVNKIVEYRTEVLLYMPVYYSHPNQPFYYQLMGVFDTPKYAIKFSSIYYSNDLNCTVYRELTCDLTEPIYETEDEKYYSLVPEEYDLNGGSDLTAGTDLVINNGIIGVNTNGTAIGDYAFVEGQSTQANGPMSHAEGANTIASGIGSHSEGESTSAVGIGSHAEGNDTIANGNYSHAEGLFCEAINEAAHAEGAYTSAIGWESHTEGCETIAGDNYMHVGGKYNYTSANAAFVIGNGEDNVERSDAFIIDWNGTVSANDYKTSAGDSVAEIIRLFKSLSSWATATNQGWIPPNN